MLYIYKITIIGCDKVYIGSTKNFNQRKQRHKEYSLYYFNPSIQLYYIIRENGGWDNCIMEIIEENSSLEREAYWINYYGENCLNIRNPIGVDEETKKIRLKKNNKKYYDKMYEDEEKVNKRKEYYRQYYLKNKKNNEI